MRWAVLLSLIVVVPSFAHAGVIITEIMYAPDGADATHEWIEVCNTESATVDIANWKFFEADTNHGLALIAGNSELSENSCAVIADNASVFAGDYPAFTGTLFDSAFSLKNTGEELSLKNDSGTVVDTVTYTDLNGAKDDGNSLHRDGSTFSASVPTPGEHAALQSGGSDSGGSGNQTSSAETTGAVTNTTVFSYESVTIQPPEDVFIRAEDSVHTVVHAPVVFRIESYDATGAVVESGFVEWAFGDGGSAVGREVSHAYVFTGTYTAVVKITAGALTDTHTLTVVVEELQAELFVDPQFRWIGIRNKSEVPLDISSWRLHAGGQYFSFPLGTQISSDELVKFPRNVTKLSLVSLEGSAQLVYPNGQLALESSIFLGGDSEPESNSLSEVNGIEEEVLREPANVGSTSVSSVQKDVRVSAIGRSIPVFDVLREAPDTLRQEPVVAERNTAAAIVSDANVVQQERSNSTIWFLLLAFLLLGSTGVAIMMLPKPRIVEGYEIVEKRE